MPPTPIIRDTNWPLLNVSKGYFDGSLAPAARAPEEAKAAGAAAAAAAAINDEDVGAGWGGDDDVAAEGGEREEFHDAGAEEEAGGGEGWDIEGIENLPEASGVPQASVGSDEKYFAMPTLGVAAAQRWAQSSALAGDHVAAGSFPTAMQMLNRQCGIVNFAPLKELFMSVALASHASLSSLSNAPPLDAPLQRNCVEAPWNPRGGSGAPALSVTLPQLVEKLKTGYKAFTDGKLTDAQAIFLSIVQALSIVVVGERQEVDEVKELLGITREYLLALHLEQSRRKDFAADVLRQTELSAYMTHCNLQPLHSIICLRSAISAAVKVCPLREPILTLPQLKNFNTAASFCRRLLELNPKKEFQDQALKVLKVCDATPSNERDIAYDERNPFVVCAASMRPVYKGTPTVRCPFCGSHYSAERNPPPPPLGWA